MFNKKISDVKEMNLSEIYNCDLIYLGSESFLQNTFYNELDFEAIKNQVENYNNEYDKIFRDYLKVGNTEVCNLLIKKMPLDDIDREQVEILTNEFKSQEERIKNELIRIINLAKEKVSFAVNNDLLTEQDREKFLSQIDIISTDNSFNFHKASFMIERISNFIENKQSEISKKLENRLDKIPTINEKDREKIIEHIRKNNIATANFLIDIIEEGNELPEENDDTNKLTDFLNKLSPLENHLQTFDNAKKTLIKTIEKLERNNYFHNIKMPSNGQRFNLAQIALENWFEVKNNKNTNLRNLEAIINFLGFEVEKITLNKNEQGRQSFVLKTHRIPRCPVAQYGSYANMNYLILCVWTLPNEHELIELVKNTNRTIQTIVFYFGRINENKRREILKTSHKERSTFIIVDDNLIFYLAGSENDTLKAFFECTIPFTHCNPYSTTASRVPKEVFFGRKEEIKQLSNERGSCIIYGGRQLGKTAILRNIEENLYSVESNVIVIFVDLKTIAFTENNSSDRILDIISKKLYDYKVLEKFKSITALKI